MKQLLYFLKELPWVIEEAWEIAGYRVDDEKQIGFRKTLVSKRKRDNFGRFI